MAYAFLNACITAVAMLALNQPATAGPPPRNISAEIGALREKIVSAELVMLPKYYELRGMTGRELDYERCRYHVRNKADLDSLIDVIADAKLEAIPANPGGYVGQILIRLNESATKTHEVILDQDFDNADTRGEYRLTQHDATTDTTAIQAGTKTERDLRFWASQHRSLAPNGCDE